MHICYDWLGYDETKSWHRPCSSSRYPHSALTRDQWIVSDYRLCILRGCPLCISMTGVTILVGGHHFLSHPLKGYYFGIISSFINKGGGIIFEQVYTFINSLTKSMSNTFSDIFDAIFFLFAVSSNFCSAIHGSINSFFIRNLGSEMRTQFLSVLSSQFLGSFLSERDFHHF